MANFVFNVAKGRAVELYNRVLTSDPVNSALVLVVLSTTSLEADGVLIDYDTLDALLAGPSSEVTNAGYARKVLAAADLAAIAPDDVNNRFAIDLSDQTWTAVSAGTDWAKLLVCYDPDRTSGTDASIIPMTAHDFTLTPDGGSITATIADIMRAAG